MRPFIAVAIAAACGSTSAIAQQIYFKPTPPTLGSCASFNQPRDAVYAGGRVFFANKGSPLVTGFDAQTGACVGAAEIGGEMEKIRTYRAGPSATGPATKATVWVSALGAELAFFADSPQDVCYMLRLPGHTYPDIRKGFDRQYEPISQVFYSLNGFVGHSSPTYINWVGLNSQPPNNCATSGWSACGVFSFETVNARPIKSEILSFCEGSPKLLSSSSPCQTTGAGHQYNRCERVFSIMPSYSSFGVMALTNEIDGAGNVVANHLQHVIERVGNNSNPDPGPFHHHIASPRDIATLMRPLVKERIALVTYAGAPLGGSVGILALGNSPPRQIPPLVPNLANEPSKWQVCFNTPTAANTVGTTCGPSDVMPNSIAIDGDGRVYVADSQNARILTFTLVFPASSPHPVYGGDMCSIPTSGNPFKVVTSLSPPYRSFAATAQAVTAIDATSAVPSTSVVGGFKLCDGVTTRHLTAPAGMMVSGLAASDDGNQLSIWSESQNLAHMFVATPVPASPPISALSPASAIPSSPEPVAPQRVLGVNVSASYYQFGVEVVGGAALVDDVAGWLYRTTGTLPIPSNTAGQQLRWRVRLCADTAAETCSAFSPWAYILVLATPTGLSPGGVSVPYPWLVAASAHSWSATGAPQYRVVYVVNNGSEQVWLSATTSMLPPSLQPQDTLRWTVQSCDSTNACTAPSLQHGYRRAPGDDDDDILFLLFKKLT